jgi:3-oxoadipate enol-lactonase
VKEDLLYILIQENREALAELKKEKIKSASVPALINSIDAIREFNLKDKISNIKQPTLIISGKNDVFISLKLQKETHDLIKDSYFELIENAGHNVLLEENTDYLGELIRGFLKKFVKDKIRNYLLNIFNGFQFV